MNISEWLFFGLLFLAVIPAYAFAYYCFYTKKHTVDNVLKIMGFDTSAGGGNGLAAPPPVYSTTMSMQELAALLKKKEKQAEDTGPKSQGHYL